MSKNDELRDRVESALTAKASGMKPSYEQQLEINVFAELCPEEYEEMKSRISETDYAFMSELERSKEGEIKKSSANLTLIFKKDPFFSDLKFEVHYQRPFFNGHPFHEPDLADINNHLQDKYNFTLADTTLLRHFFMEARTHKFNYIVENLLSAPLTIDFDPLRRYFFDGLGVEDNEHNYNLLMKHFKSAYARAANENPSGVHKDEVIILEGKQGIGKSKLLEMLGGEFYTADVQLSNFRDKDVFQTISNKLIVEFGELTGLKYAEVETVKAFMSKTFDEYRPSFGHCVVRQPRTCVFFATTNEDHYLKGTTGNRRFIPMRCGCDGCNRDIIFELKDEKTLQIDMDKVRQFWAFIREEYLKDSTTLFTKEETDYLERVQEEKNVNSSPDKIEDILNYCSKVFPENWDKMTLAQQEDWLKTETGSQWNGAVMPTQPDKMKRNSFTVKEIAYHVFGQRDKGRRNDNVAARMRAAKLFPTGVKRSSKAWGQQAEFSFDVNLFSELRESMGFNC